MIKSKTINETHHRALIRCSAKDCNNTGIFFEKLANAPLGGWFCKSCRDQLKALGIFSQE
jgi:hypothetical protein